MPYIKYCDRERYEQATKGLFLLLKDAPPGEINYVLSSIIWGIFDLKKSYKSANELMGVLECVKQEFYRRKVAPYEDEKKVENGDIWVD